MAAPALPPEVKKLRESLVKDQAPSARARTEYFDPSVFVSRHGRPYSSLKLPISTMMEMRTDSLLRFAQLVSLVPYFTGKFRIECASARKAQFVDQALRRILGRLILQFYESWNFGWQTMAKEFGLMNPSWTFIDKNAEGGPAAMPVWDGGPEVPALIWEPFVPLRPSSVAPVWTAGGAFNGIALSTLASGGYSVPTVPVADTDIIDVPRDMMAYFNDPDQAAKKIPLDHSLWVVNERDSQFGSIWGRSRLAYAYKYWWSYEMALGILNRSVERKGDPTIVVTYPQGNSRIGNQDVPNQTIAFDIGNKARSGSVLVVPSEVWGEETGTSNQSPKWAITYLKAEEQFDKLISVLGYLDTMKIRSMMISELSAFEGSGGTSSRNVAATTGERSFEAQIFNQVEWDEIINRYMIPQLCDANFPELKDEPARKVTQAYGQDESALAADILRSLANADPTSLPLDRPALLERFNIDSFEGEELAQWERRLVTQAETSAPLPAPATPNGAAGTTDTGFYYDAPQRIELADDEAMLASLPKSKHYADRTVLAQTRAVRKIWHTLLTEQYEDFAKHVSQLELADDDKRAKQVVDGWRYKYGTAVKRLSKALLTIFSRAGALELSSSKLDPKVFDPSDKAMSDWVNANVGAMVRQIEDTTRKQLSSYLAIQLEKGSSSKEIAAGIREHFAHFADWRADLIAREETKNFYNAGTLFAAEAAGSKQVQALDAQDGPTDPECERRHGRIFSISAAWTEDKREHVRGTLGWRIIPSTVELSLSYIPVEDVDGVAARIDTEGVIHLAEGLAQDVEGAYLEQVVSWHIATH
jgi:SPP1 gp7 family putative phage head morphogenesis protein